MLTIKGTNKINDPYDSVVTYISSRLVVFSKAFSGISLISFPPRNLKKKYNRTYTCFFFQLVNKYSLKIIDGLKRIVHLRKGGGGLYFNAISYGGLQPEVQPLTFLHTIFGIKDTPLVFLLLKTGTPVTYYFGRVF